MFQIVGFMGHAGIRVRTCVLYEPALDRTHFYDDNSRNGVTKVVLTLGSVTVLSPLRMSQAQILGRMNQA